MTQIDAVLAPEGASCSLHEGTPALIVCTRCGSYIGACCVAAARGRAHCAPCAALVLHKPAVLKRLGSGALDAALAVSAAQGAVLGLALGLQASVVIGALLIIANAVLLSVRAQTVGMLPFALEVLDGDGSPPSALRLLIGRLLLPGLLLFCCSGGLADVALLLGLNALPLLRPNRTTGLDMLSGTRVVERPRRPGT